MRFVFQNNYIHICSRKPCLQATFSFKLSCHTRLRTNPSLTEEIEKDANNNKFWPRHVAAKLTGAEGRCLRIRPEIAALSTALATQKAEAAID